jgi:hypothetical protein
MLLTQCACCAAELGLSSGKKCGRCSTRYCGPECQVQHWKEGGHDTLCKKIKKAGGAEQYNANKKYAEAVAAAAEKCADDTKGQTCFICTQALHWKTKEGLVRGCACRGTAGFAHVSCLVEQAKILMDEAEENNLGAKVLNERWARWEDCSLCEQKYHGVVRCALGWACWKTYLGRPETNQARVLAMNVLGSGLFRCSRYADALPVREAELSMLRRVGAHEQNILAVQTNLANVYQALGRLEHSLQLERDVYHGSVRLLGEEHRDTLTSVNNLAASLHDLKRFEEAKSLLRNMMPVARRVLGENYELTFAMRMTYARALYKDEGAMLDDLREAETTLEETLATARRVLGGAHPLVPTIERDLRKARAALRARETLAEAMAATTLGDA